MNCPVCGEGSRSTRVAARTDRDYRVERCPSCRLAFVVPRPTESDLADFYGTSYFNADTGFGYGDYEGASWAGDNAVRTWSDLKVWAPQVATVRNRRLLDVGAATGQFAARAQQDGWRAVACEIGDTARESAAAKGLETVVTIEEASGPFGLITMFHVLEHLIDPLDTLSTARRLVDLDGLIAIEVPQWNSAGRLARGAGWSQFKPPEHINFFTRRSIRVALERAGWEVVSRSTPYPRSGALALEAARGRHVRSALTEGAKFAAGTAGFGAFLRIVARPARMVRP